MASAPRPKLSEVEELLSHRVNSVIRAEAEKAVGPARAQYEQAHKALLEVVRRQAVKLVPKDPATGKLPPADQIVVAEEHFGYGVRAKLVRGKFEFSTSFADLFSSATGVAKEQAEAIRQADTKARAAYDEAQNRVRHGRVSSDDLRIAAMEITYGDITDLSTRVDAAVAALLKKAGS